MLDPETDAQRGKMVLTAQIIVAALAAGCLSFLVVSLLIVRGEFNGPESGLGNPITLAAMFVAFGILAARVVVPGIVTTQLLRQFANREPQQPQWKDLFGVYQTTLIIKAAMVEGAIFLLLVLHIVQHSPWTLGLAVVFLLILLTHMPTRGRVDAWIEQQSRAMRE